MAANRKLEQLRQREKEYSSRLEGEIDKVTRNQMLARKKNSQSSQSNYMGSAIAQSSVTAAVTLNSEKSPRVTVDAKEHVKMNHQ